MPGEVSVWQSMQGLGKNIGVFDPKVGVGSSSGGSSQHPTPVLDRGYGFINTPISVETHPWCSYCRKVQKRERAATAPLPLLSR